MRLRLLSLAAISALLVGLPTTAAAQTKKKKVVPAVQGKQAPDFSVELMGTKKKTLMTLSKMYKDKPVVLVFGSYT